MQRFVDVVIAAVGLILISPLLLLVAVLLRFTGEGKVFYRQTRVGQGGEEFQMLKFATMLEDSPNLGAGDITVKDDPRVLPVGRFLRKTKINELPQIWNVLKGDMSLVGPRPLTPRNFAYYSPEVQAEIQKVRPGVTGIGSVAFRDEESILARSNKGSQEAYREEITPYKGQLEVWYSKNNTLKNYFLLLLMTAVVIVRPNSRLHERWLSGLPTREPRS